MGAGVGDSFAYGGAGVTKESTLLLACDVAESAIAYLESLGSSIIQAHWVKVDGGVAPRLRAYLSVARKYPRGEIDQEEYDRVHDDATGYRWDVCRLLYGADLGDRKVRATAFTLHCVPKLFWRPFRQGRKIVETDQECATQVLRHVVNSAVTAYPEDEQRAAFERIKKMIGVMR